MGVGINLDTSGNPWLITYDGSNGTALPATVIGAQNTGKQAFPFIPKRIVWTSKTASAGDEVVLKDVPANGGTAREIAHFVATGADYQPPQEWKRGDSDGYFVGLQVTTFSSGTLAIYL